jgi:hypothetical protein
MSQTLAGLTFRSRTQHESGAPLRDCPPLSTPYGVWHALCFALFLPGCPFVLPLIEEQENMAPVIVESDPREGDELELSMPSTVVYVVVEDENDLEALTFLWTIERSGEQGNTTPLADGPRRGSALRLDPDPRFDGRLLTVRATDSFGESARREWIIRVPEEAK